MIPILRSYPFLLPDFQEKIYQLQGILHKIENQNKSCQNNDRAKLFVERVLA
jgi:hypothetical protein